MISRPRANAFEIPVPARAAREQRLLWKSLSRTNHCLELHPVVEREQCERPPFTLCLVEQRQAQRRGPDVPGDVQVEIRVLEAAVAGFFGAAYAPEMPSAHQPSLVLSAVAGAFAAALASVATATGTW
jgi:hypothetical protein